MPHPTPTPTRPHPALPPAPAARTAEDAGLLIAERMLARAIASLDPTAAAGRDAIARCRSGMAIILDRRAGWIGSDAAIGRMGVLASLAYQAAHREVASGDSDGASAWAATHALRAATLALEAGTL